jgi:hypothetical protein
MPKRIRVSMTCEVGQPDAGSLVVSCGVEFDAGASQCQDGDVLETDVGAAVSLCRQLLEAELGRHQQTQVATCYPLGLSDRLFRNAN